MPRAIWSGSIGFGLVNVPVRMYSAIEEGDLHFHLLHVKDDSRIGYEKICKEEGRPVPDDEIVKAYELEDGEYVYVTDEDFEAAQAERYRRIEIEDFVPYADIDPIYFERTYFLGPVDGDEKVYALLVRAMEESGLAAIATYVMRDKQQLGCLRVREGVIALEKMYFADEIRPIDEIRPKRVSVPKRELEMARGLIDQFSGAFEPEKYRDTYREALLGVIEAKRKGEEIHREPRRDDGAAPDLMAALKASLDAAKGHRAPRGEGGANGDLGALSKDELVGRAKRAGIRGYSKMRKEELVEALEAA